MAEENNYGYYSFNLKKEFKTLEELKEAEAAEKEKVDKEKLALKERKQKAKEVEDAYKEYISTLNRCQKEIAEANNKYLKLRSEFIKKYHYFHMTYSSPENTFVDQFFASNGLLDWFDR